MIDYNVPTRVIDYANEFACGRTSFCSWLTIIDNDIFERVFAFKRSKKEGLEIVQVLQRSSANDKTYYKNLGFGYWGYFAFYCKDEYDVTYKNINLTTKILNLDILKETKYKYLRLSEYDSIIKIIKLYKEYPAVEFFLKLDLPLTKRMLSLAQKDNSFRKYLFKISLKYKYIYFNSQCIIFGFYHNCDLEYASDYFRDKRSLCEVGLLKYSFIDNNLERIIKYLENNRISVSNFSDYINACVYLKLDMTLNKNLYPHDFMRMHDLRINEYDSAKEKAEAKSRRKFYKDFKAISQKYKFLEYEKDYLLKIASSVQSLKHEGKILCHCVGTMGYDKKMIDEKSLIFFIRNKERPDTPFATLEYDLNKNKISQIYGKNDSDPPENVLTFANHWCKLANNRLKKFVNGEKYTKKILGQA